MTSEHGIYELRRMPTSYVLPLTASNKFDIPPRSAGSYYSNRHLVSTALNVFGRVTISRVGSLRHLFTRLFVADPRALAGEIGYGK